jgi:hypothetical protein
VKGVDRESQLASMLTERVSRFAESLAKERVRGKPGVMIISANTEVDLR